MKKLHLLFVPLCCSLLLVQVGCKRDDSTSMDTSAAATNNPTGTNTPAHDADNTARNQQDRGNGTVTPVDQGSSEADRTLTQQIRKAVVSTTNNYSMDARNVKIIAMSGKVTLRGPVDNDGEKSGIDAIAKSVAGSGNVDDQLEVKTNTPAVNH